MQRATKRQRVLELLNECAIPAQQLANILAALRARPEINEEPISRRTLDRAYTWAFTEVAQTISVPLNDGSAFEWEVAHFGKAVDYLCRECSHFGEIVADLFATRPPTATNPWGMILYFDEAVPGDPLRLDQRKKMMCCYCSIREFGPGLLKHESMWVPLGVIRRNIIKKVPGGWSHVLRLLLRRLLLDEGNLLLGYPMRFLSGSLVFCSLSHILGDEDALRQAWAAKGSGGVFPCMECHNVSGIGAKSCVREDDDFVVDIGCTDVQRFRRRSNEELWLQVDTLSRSKPYLSQAEFAKQEISMGLVLNEQGLLRDEALRPYCRPMDVQTHDPTHLLFADGICCTELNLLLPRLLAAGVSFELLDQFMNADWSQPRALKRSKAIADTFSPSRCKSFSKKRELNMFASEVLAICPPLCHLFEQRPAEGPSLSDRLPLELDSFQKLTAVVRLVSRSKHGRVEANALAVALKAHGDAFKLAYSGEGVKPKFHYARKLPHQLQRDGTLYDTFVCERKHSMMKQAGHATDNTRVYERTVLTRALALQVGQLKKGRLQDGLRRGAPCPELAAMLGVDAAMVGEELVVGGTPLCADDVVFLGEKACQIVSGVTFETTGTTGLALLVHEFTFIARASSVSARWQRSVEMAVHFVRDVAAIRLSPAWSFEAGERVLVLE